MKLNKTKLSLCKSKYILRVFEILFFIVFFATLCGCYDGHSDNNDNDLQTQIAYDDPYNWASLPSSIVKDVDVFYAYPTVYFDADPPNMDITDEKNRQDVIDKMNAQMGLYSPYTNIFAPYYRQMYRDGFDDLPAEEASELLNVAYEDIVCAFKYYMQNLNDGRPFILVGHSQGAGILVDLLRNEFHNESYMEKMIAAYTTGVSIMNSDTVNYPWIKIAQSATDLGVVIIYNTLDSQHYESSSFQTGSLCVNPLLWTTDTTYAPQTENLGAVWTDSDGNITQEIENFTDAQIRDDGALAVTTPDPDDYYDPDRQPYGGYHDYDQIFFYRNLQQNVADRIDAYYAKE
ncbi:Protein of unknown function [Desulfocicer vacuolatum DSM 3385]|uniref:DUF3089 domain-containing protein n=2 Tax=Desulfocicer vacuolatum TaxID=2298 RepID=A0A1W2AGJ2_9BACT|nr:Protein of unknown function [Desulfocicer vacuolatum DSM 3385]